ncbi:hypothetical protein HNP37_003299 [Flavobacterium nitrogenifigens]|uniref:Lipoprotein n=2 Tax=Flavobacterium TaxID=237 RepID=A0A7W7N987_9FLAO|nr:MULTISPECIES: hypothetical protein [Flavobacterium]MBB4803224.1 hypothetical protein [Flavobacterium nitrogenifigens]MBB6388182.1 hypothetical protein [Flavobacterium notoginsengisoli]
MKKRFIIFVVIAVVSSCKKADAEATPLNSYTFYFENPQPINDSELNSFPPKFQGLYKTADSNFLRITDDRILKEYYFKLKVHRKELDSQKSEYDLVDGKLITKDTKDKYDVLKIGDSIELSQTITDTLYRLSYNQKLKRISGQLVLSTRDSVFWEMEVISLEKNILKFKHIFLQEDLKRLDSVTQTKGQMLDSLSYLIKPTRKEFKNILKIKNLGKDRLYTKVSE